MVSRCGMTRQLIVVYEADAPLLFDGLGSVPMGRAARIVCAPCACPREQGLEDGVCLGSQVQQLGIWRRARIRVLVLPVEGVRDARLAEPILLHVRVQVAALGTRELPATHWVEEAAR